MKVQTYTLEIAPSGGLLRLLLWGLGLTLTLTVRTMEGTCSETKDDLEDLADAISLIGDEMASRA